MIEAKVKDLLLASSDISGTVGARIAPLIRSTKDDVPAITYAAEEPQQKKNLDGSRERIIRQRFEIECWHHHYDGAKQLARQVIRTLNDVTGQHGQYYFHMITVGGDSEDKMDEANVVNLTANLIYEDDEETANV
ncbi:hypothetical protein ACR0ST_04390 [Aliidiomarina sp. Khilg15.8]